ncbi:polysaccharide pyruvyl transferase family protein [bacterium]|nr:polysaccharide pyruvyl transferase family protein [bacterium]
MTPLEKGIGVFGHYGNQNLGDEAIIAAVIHNTKRLLPGIRLCGFSINPQDTQAKHGIEAFPVRQPRASTPSFNQNNGHENLLPNEDDAIVRIKRMLKKIPLFASMFDWVMRAFKACANMPGELRFIWQSYQRLRSIDLLFVAGSGQLFDGWGGPWSYPYTLFKWAVLAKLAKTKLCFVSVGAGPIRSPLSKLLIRQALSLAEYRSFRDASSERLIKSIGFKGETRVFPDLAYSLHLNSKRNEFYPSTYGLMVGINPIPYYDLRYWDVSNPEVYRDYIEKVAAFASWLLERNYGVAFFPTQLRADNLVIDDIMNILKRKPQHESEGKFVRPDIKTSDDLLQHIAAMDIVIATRFHGVLLSYLLSKPAIGIGYAQKTRDLMANMAQVNYFISINEFEVSTLIERFFSLVSSAQRARIEIERRLPPFRAALESQYHIIFDGFRRATR